MQAPNKWLVETSWLAEHLDAPDVVVLDGSMHLPTAKRDANAEYLAEHIPGAQFTPVGGSPENASVETVDPVESFLVHVP